MLSDTWLRQDMMDLILRNARFDKFNLMNCVLIRFPIMPCKPMLALMNPTHTKDSILVHVELARESATLP